MGERHRCIVDYKTLGIKNYKLIYYQCFHFEYFSKIILLIVEKIYLYLYRVLAVSVSSFFHKYHVPCSYPNLCPCSCFLGGGALRKLRLSSTTDLQGSLEVASVNHHDGKQGIHSYAHPTLTH